MGRKLEGENLVGGIDPGGTSDRDVDSLAKSVEVDDLWTCGVRNSLLGLSLSLHVVC